MCDEETRTRFAHLEGRLDEALTTINERLDLQDVETQTLRKEFVKATKRMSARDSAIFKNLRAIRTDLTEVTDEQTKLKLGRAEYHGAIKATMAMVAVISLGVAIWSLNIARQERIEKKELISSIVRQAAPAAAP